MKFKSTLIFISCIVAGCSSPNETKKNTDFVEGIVEYAIIHKANKIIELPDLYDTLSFGIPERSTLLLAEIVLQKGFVEIESGSGNYPPRGPRIATKVYLKDSCVCQISKIYYSTVEENAFEMAERIRCMELSDYLK